jgi:hypothetical protein
VYIPLALMNQTSPTGNNITGIPTTIATTIGQAIALPPLRFHPSCLYQGNLSPAFASRRARDFCAALTAFTIPPMLKYQTSAAGNSISGMAITSAMMNAMLIFLNLLFFFHFQLNTEARKRLPPCYLILKKRNT